MDRDERKRQKKKRYHEWLNGTMDGKQKWGGQYTIRGSDDIRSMSGPWKDKADYYASQHGILPVMVMINEETFRSYRFFRDIPSGSWLVIVAAGLQRFEEYMETICLGICECLCGAEAFGMRHTNFPMMYPEDRKQYGTSDIEVDHTNKVIFVRNMITSQTPISLVMSFEDGE